MNQQLGNELRGLIRSLRKPHPAPPAAPKSEPWWESKLVLLLVGAVITSIVVPWLQYFQKNLEWKRQQLYDRSNYRITMMRDALKEFSSLATLPGEANERGQPCFLAESHGPTGYEDCRKQFIEVQNRRFAQAGKVIPLLTYFPDPARPAGAFYRYVRQASEYMRLLEKSIEWNACLRGATPCSNREKAKTSLDSAIEQTEGAFKELDLLYEAVTTQMKEIIEDVEKTTEHSLL